MKLILVVTLAGWLRYETAHRRFTGLALPFALTLVPVALVMKQPDLGTALLLVPILFGMLFAAGARPRHLSVVTAMGVVAGLLLYFVPGLMAPYQKDRVLGFIAQGSAATGPDAALLSRTQGHQLDRSKMLVAVGGLAGADETTLESIEALPERQTDFVFPVFAASWGLLGTAGLFLAYFVFLAVLLSTATRVREPSGRLLVVGVFTLFAVQVLVNLGMTVGLLPVVGVTLPFFSYGGSSLLTSFLAVGLVLNVGVDPPIEFGRDDFD
jgi:cell division protein FtsW (lipid II flippase)